MKKKNKKNSADKKGRALSAFSGLSGSLSLLGGWQICHNLCLGIIALLSVIGITIVGMPFLFLTQYTIYFWSVAILLLIPTLILYRKNRKCMSIKLILFNVGIVIASVPFIPEAYQLLFWIAGGILIASSAWMFFKPRIQK